MKNISGEYRYPCVDCLGMGLVIPEMEEKCPYCDGRGLSTEEEFLAANQRIGIPLSRLIVNGEDVGLIIDLTGELE